MYSLSKQMNSGSRDDHAVPSKTIVVKFSCVSVILPSSQVILIASPTQKDVGTGSAIMTPSGKGGGVSSTTNENTSLVRLTIGKKFFGTEY